MDIDISISESGAIEMSSYLLSSFANGDSNSSNSLIGSEDSHMGNSSRTKAPRQKINARERYRTFNVNSAYEALRGLIPTEPVNRKLSKIEIIRLASSYITHLRSTLYAGTDRQPCLLHKWDGDSSTGRVSICTFCMKPKSPQSAQC
ncbi:transcription factor 15 [Drosophila busckii]|uniref:transcription factor 15 n=1 Tax=Drosophila busckii TaxID=30019 RepID=UPI00083EC6FF|nr:transcription factor 15 [Drosophila busckii]